MTDNPSNSRREYYRLRYPKKDRPTLLLNDQARLEVVELSERGFRLSGDAIDNFAHGQPIEGTLELPSGPIDVRGKVSRIDHRELVVVAVSGITFACILEEQRRVLPRFLGQIST